MRWRIGTSQKAWVVLNDDTISTRFKQHTLEEDQTAHT
jgi:hypothetical protein